MIYKAPNSQKESGHICTFVPLQSLVTQLKVLRFLDDHDVALKHAFGSQYFWFRLVVVFCFQVTKTFSLDVDTAGFFANSA